jgi:methyl-accepting chemotaxis protein
LIRDNPTSAQAAELAESDRAQNIFASLQKAANAARDEIAERSASAQKWQDQLIGLAHMASAGGGLTTLLLAVLVGWWLTRSIARPVTEMTAVMKNLADGDVTIAVPGVGRNDEIGRIAEAVQVFKDQAIKKIQQKAQEEEDIKRWQQEDAERLAREAEAARQDQIAINNLASGLARLIPTALSFDLCPFSRSN